MNRLTPISDTGAPTHPGRSISALTLLALVVCVLTGCQAQKQSNGVGAGEYISLESIDRLSQELKEFRDYYDSTMDRAAMEIERKSSSREVRKKSLRWHKLLTDQFRSVANEQDPREALVDIWALCCRLKNYFETGDGRSLFDEDQDIATDAMNRVNERIEQIARRAVPEELFEVVRQKIIEYADANPIQGDYRNLDTQDLSQDPESKSLVESIIGVPLAPISALQGIGSTPKSIRAIATSMDNFTDVAEDLPANARRQAQLLVMNLEETDTVKDTVASIKQFSDSTARISQIVDDLPQKTREQAEILIDRIDASQSEIGSTLVEAQNTLELVRKATDDMKSLNADTAGTIVELKETSNAVESAADSATLTIQEVLKFFPANRKDETGQLLGKEPLTPEEIAAKDPTTGDKFSFQAITTTANALTDTTANLQSLLTELHSILDDGTVPKQIGELQTEFAESLNLTSARVKTIIDHAAVRGAQLIALLFALLIVLRFVNLRKRTPNEK